MAKKAAKKASKNAASKKTKEKDLRKARGRLILVISLHLIGSDRSSKKIKAQKQPKKGDKK